MLPRVHNKCEEYIDHSALGRSLFDFFGFLHAERVEQVNLHRAKQEDFRFFV